MPRTGESATIYVDGVPIAVTRKRVRRINMRAGGGTIRMSIPLYCPLAEAEAFARSKRDWIARMASEAMSDSSREWADGETAFIWGRELPIAVIEGASRTAPKAILDTDRIAIVVADELAGFDAEAIAARKTAVDGLRVSELKRVLPELSAWAEERVGERASAWSVRTMRTRWGSCTPKTRRIRLNAELAAFPYECAESVAVHECVHLLEPGHGERFHALMDSLYPDWKAARKILNARKELR